VFIFVWDHTDTKRARLHLEFHTGHDADLLRKLQEYGIFPESMHETLGGQYTDDMFLAWLKRREIVEKRQAQQVTAPSDRESEVAVRHVPLERKSEVAVLQVPLERKSEVAVLPA
jgi:hypothetical protein